MKTINYLLLISLLLGATACKDDFLERNPGVPLSQDNVFADPVLAKGFADNSYNFLLDDYGRLDATYKGTTGQLADEAMSASTGGPISVMNKGDFLNGNATDVGPVYTRMYQGIRNVNVMLEKNEQVPWGQLESANLIKAQMLFLRSMFYFELVKRFGGVILLDRPLGLTDNSDLPRSTYDETVSFILKDLTDAEAILTTEQFIAPNATYSPATGWNEGNYGRPTVGAVRALRSRLLLLDASPLHNPANDLSKWKRAADAAKEIMNMNVYSLHPTYGTLLNIPNSPEYILIKVRPPRSFSGMLNDFIVPPSSGGAQATLNPTQNHVDLYEMRPSGKPITDPTSGYNPQDPYKDRDPRFYTNLIYNDQTWQGRKIEMWTNNATTPASYGRDYQPTSNNYTRSRYYVRKLWPEVYRGGVTATALLNFVFFRYGEVLLNHAEALNEAEGPVADVYVSVNQVRVRAGMLVLPTGLTKDQMRARIHNERAVELAFEEQRWWDILRWKKGPEIVQQPIKGMEVLRTGATFTYNIIPMDPIYQRIFQDHMHLYPIPRAELYKSAGILKQNPGW